MTPEQKAKENFRRTGITVAQWAAKNGFKPSLVYAVLTGQRKCFRGKSYEIARALHLLGDSGTQPQEEKME